MLRRAKSLSLLVIIVLCSALSSSAIHSEEARVDYDTTRVREVKPVKKNVSGKIGDIPGEILKLPIYAFELLARTLMMNPPVSSATSLFHIKKGKNSFLPVIAYSTRAGVKLGFRYKLRDKMKTGNSLKFKSYYSTNRYQLYRLQFISPSMFSSHIGLNLGASYKKQTRQSFYGIGMTSAKANEVNLTLENSVFEVRLPVHLYKWLSVSLYTINQTTNVFDGNDPNLEGRLKVISADSALNSSSENFDPLRRIDFGVSLELDRRNSSSRPTKGSHILANYERVVGIKRSDGRNFDIFNIEVQHFIHLWRNRVLAVRTSLSRADAVGANDKDIPYYLASRLGGSEILRGYNSGRFVDNDAAFVTLEYRYPIYDHTDAFLFWDEGRVYNDVTKSAVFSDWRKSYGFGFRIWNQDKALATLQVARGNESTRFYFDFGATW